MNDARNYKARLVGVPDWQGFESCSLAISVGMPYHEGDKLAAAVDLVNRRFSRCLVDLGDTLQRHNLMAAGMDAQEALSRTWSNGTDWLTRNNAILSGLRVPKNVCRWNQWLHHPKYQSTRQAVDRAYQTDATFRAAVDFDLASFLDRRAVVDLHDRNRISAHNREFILEECAGNVIVEHTHPGVILYPGSELTCLKLIRSNQVFGVPYEARCSRHGHLKFERKDSQQCG